MLTHPAVMLTHPAVMRTLPAVMLRTLSIRYKHSDPALTCVRVTVLRETFE